MARFYGFSHEEMVKMEFKTFSQYHQSIEVIRAHEALVSLKVSDFPKQSKDNRQKIHDYFYKLSRPKDLRNEKPVSTNDLVRRMRGMGV